MDKMAKPLRVLIVEDNSTDTELMLRELRRAGFKPDSKRVDTEANYLANLDPALDIILSDYSMPQFSGLRALELLKERRLEVPFLIVSGIIGEETAVAAVQDGAADYLLKDRLTRLGQAVERALEEKRIRDESKRAQMRLALQEQQYRLLFEINPNPMWVSDTKTSQIVAVNQAAISQYGYSRDEFLKLKLKDLQPSKDLADGGQFRHLRKDGSIILVEIYSSPVVWDGAAAGIVTAIDITERKRTGDMMRAILESALDCVITIDHQGRVVEFNPAAEKTFGYPRDKAVGQLLMDLIIPPSLRESHRRGLSRYLDTGEAPVLGKRVELTGMRSDGSEFPVEVAIIRIGSQQPPMFTGFIRDITDRKDAEGQLREQADIINRAHDAIIVRNFDDRLITFWNNGAERLYGWSASEAIGKPVGELILADAQEIEMISETLLSAGEFRGQLKEFTKDRREVTVDVCSTLICNSDGTPRSVLSMSKDITEQKKLETQLLRSQRLESIGTLASGVAHDLNNILTPILMCAETLRTNFDPDDAQTAISLIEESARRGAEVVKQVLTFARGIEGERVTISPRHLIDEMVDIGRKTFPKSIEISDRYPEELWSIQGDPTQLHQALLNLAVNARDAMPNGGSLILAAENIDVDEGYAAMTPGAQIGPHVLLSVADTGAGMPRATIDKIFDPFFTTKEVGKGTGLGLSTALGIVKSHGGVISVYSEIGSGTTFKILLPAQVSEETSRKSEIPPELLDGHGELVLVVDDEPNILSVTKMILEKHNYGILDAHDGPEALALLAQQRDSIKLVLTDISMPYMDGVALVRTIKKMKPDTKFIACTGQGEETRVAELQSLGVTNFLMKPYDTGKLLKTLGHTLEGEPDAQSECP